MTASSDLTASPSWAVQAQCCCQGKPLASLIKWFRSLHLHSSIIGSPALACHSPPEYTPKDGQSFVDPISFQYSASLSLNKITSKIQTRLIHISTLPKLSSKGANTCLMFLWTHCCPFTCIYFAWPVAEPWKLENKLLFSKSCQRWPLCQRVDCGTNTPLIRGLFCSAAVSTVTYLSAEAFSLSCLCWKS